MQADIHNENICKNIASGGSQFLSMRTQKI